MNLAVELGTHVRTHQLGVVYAAETGFTLSRRPDTVRAPDVAFIRRDRLPSPEPIGYPELAPDLVVEVLSPGDQMAKMMRRISQFLKRGVPLVWLVDPEAQAVTVYRPGKEHYVVEGADE